MNENKIYVVLSVTVDDKGKTVRIHGVCDTIHKAKSRKNRYKKERNTHFIIYETTMNGWDNYIIG